MAGSQNGNESSKEYEINRASVVVPHDEENPTTMAGLHSRDESSEECPNNAAPFVIPHDEEQPATMASSHSGHETLKEYQINKAPVVVPHNEEKPTVMTGSHSENESSEENQNSNAPIVPGDEEQPATIAGLHSGNEFSKDYPNNNAAVVSHDQEPPVTNKAGPGLTKLPAGAAATAERDQMNQAKEPPAAVPEAKEPMVPFFKLFSFADNYDYTLMFFGTIGAFVHGTALPLFFLFFGRVLNGFGGVTADPISTVNKYSLALLYLGLACLFSAWLEVSFWTQTGTRQSAKMRAKYLEAILRQDVEYFDTDSNTGSFITSISSDPLSMQDAISEKLGSTLHCVATFVTGFGVAFGSEWRIALLTIAVLPFIVLVVGLFAWSLTTSTSRASAAYAEGGMVAEQAIAQIRVLYSFVGESKFIKDYHNALQKTLKLGARAGLAKGLGIGAIYGVLFASWALLLWYGGKLIRQGTGNGGQTLSAIFAIIIGGMSLGQVMPNVAVVAKGRGAAFRIFKLISHEARINKPDSKAKMLDSVEGRIELRNVDFSYPSRPDVPIFQNFSLTIPTGKTLAIVGTSGSGKSTVVSLIERFYDPTGGEILFDGHDLRSLNIVWLRDQIGLVNQEPVLFATTIKANMLYGKGNASEAEIWAAAKAANVDSFIDQLPHKYETQVGERGVQLSGGEKQRVAIARAMLKNPSVLLLDEATSALDAGSEQVVQEALNRLMVGRTTVIVAHRLSTIRNANTIAVVQQGRIIETGTHDELVSRPDGAYSTLVRLQELAETKDGSKRNSFEELVSLERQGNGVELAMHNRISLRLSHDQRKSVDSSRRWSLSQKGNWEDNELSPQKGFLRRLLMISKADWPFGLGGVLGSMLAGTLNPLYAWLVSTVVVEYYDKNFHHMRSEVSKYALAFVSLGAAAPFFYTLQHYSWGVTGERLVNRVREMMFGRILRNEVGWFDRDENSSSQILARLSSDATTVRAALGDRISILVQNLTLMLLAFIYSLVIQWKMTFVMASVVPLILVSFIAVNLFTRGFAGDVAKAYSRATQVAAEATANIRTVAAFNAEDKVQRLFVSELEGPLSKSFLMGHVSGFLFGLSQLMMYGAYGLGLWYAGQLIKKNEASFLQVLRVFLIMVVVAFSIAETMTLAPDLVKGGRAVESVFQVLNRKTEIDPEKPKGDRIKNLEGDVELKNVAFVYPSRPDVLIFSDLNLKVCAGRSLALVGASGSGKSTVISLIERFYDPSSGAVLIDGKDLRNYNLRSLRKHIALVIQEPVLFSVSIQENILFGRSGPARRRSSRPRRPQMLTTSSALFRKDTKPWWGSGASNSPADRSNEWP